MCKKINQDIQRKSNLTLNHLEKVESLDIDYDFPSQPVEDEEYDEPCPVVVQQEDSHEQLDYDDPVQRYS